MDSVHTPALDHPGRQSATSIEQVGRKRPLSATFRSPPCLDVPMHHAGNPSVPVTDTRADANLRSPNGNDDNDDDITLLDLLESSTHQKQTNRRYHGNVPLIDLVDSSPPSPNSPERKGPPSTTVVDLCTPPSPPAITFLSASCAVKMPTVAAPIKTPRSDTTPHHNAMDHAHPVSPSRPRIPRTRRYPRQTSAYLQNLAEMCWMFLHDSRWRTASSGSTLLRWEQGDDLKGILALAGQYIPPPPKVPVPCPCLLCTNTTSKQHSPQQAPATCEGGSSDAMEEGAGHSVDTSSGWTGMEPKSSKTGATSETEIEYDEEESRQLYLLSRLFYRKGPWFRIDDIFQRYYANPKPEHKNTRGSVVHADLLEQQMNTVVPELLEDLRGLVETGMVRGFENEMECGKVVDCFVLTADERRATLQKLGGGSRKKQAEGNCSIWKQMTTQKSLFSANGMLPVIRHVDEILLDKLARQLVVSCSCEKDVPKNEMSLHAAAIKHQMSRLHKVIFKGKSVSHLCFRLTEKPMLAIQRCVRLYVCATSGPGSMRGNGNNGWRSVLDSPTTTVPKKKSSVLVPPGKDTWHEIRYPGLEYRFGLRCAPFFHTYQPVPFAAASHGKTDCLQVFSSVQEFRRWERCVEIRAFADYAVEFEDSVRYDQRRTAKGKDPIRGCVAEDFVDTLKLDRVDIRTGLLRGFLGACESRLEMVNDNITKQIANLDLGVLDLCSQALLSLGILVTQVLIADWNSANKQQTSKEVLTARPWLRHLSWQCCLAYVLWDIIPIFERTGHYALAIQALETVLFGTCDTAEKIQTGTLGINGSRGWTPLLSRRARGKAIDRLVIDLSHVFRAQCSLLDKQKKKSENDKFQKRLVDFSRDMIKSAAPLSSFGFSSIRTIARRLKKPLRETLDRSILAIEAQELGLRSGPDAEANEKNEDCNSKYIDWQPVTDISIANAVAGENDPGSRCSFIGHDDTMLSTSLNVEEYALEMYGSGRLPLSSDDKISGGGWVGWHNEGSHLRALFRIICGVPILGAGYGCMSNKVDNVLFHLSPYQEAPFDLHVGFELTNHGIGHNTPRPACGIFFRRSSTIHSYLELLRRCDAKVLTDLVFDSIKARLEFARRNSIQDASLEKDTQQVRTFSALAAGLGGKVLARAFQCMLYDYRHYSGGLPDLMLIRTVKRVDGVPEHVDMDWIGESFSKERRDQEAGDRAMSILFDKDDEYLGCEKVGDFQPNSRNKRPPNMKAGKSFVPDLAQLPERLQLYCNEIPVEVQCLFVEVKSSNDRLDARQEDWLNVLSLEGLARVCKFEDSKKGQQKKKKHKT